MVVLLEGWLVAKCLHRAPRVGQQTGESWQPIFRKSSRYFTQTRLSLFRQLPVVMFLQTKFICLLFYLFVCKKHKFVISTQADLVSERPEEISDALTPVASVFSKITGNLLVDMHSPIALNDATTSRFQCQKRRAVPLVLFHTIANVLFIQRKKSL